MQRMTTVKTQLLHGDGIRDTAVQAVAQRLKCFATEEEVKLLSLSDFSSNVKAVSEGNDNLLAALLHCHREIVANGRVTHSGAKDRPVERLLKKLRDRNAVGYIWVVGYKTENLNMSLTSLVYNSDTPVFPTVIKTFAFSDARDSSDILTISWLIELIC
jgi:hypothetical protein